MAPFAADWEAPAEAELAWGPCHGRLIRLIRRPSRCSPLHRTEQSSLRVVVDGRLELSHQPDSGLRIGCEQIGPTSK